MSKKAWGRTSINICSLCPHFIKKINYVWNGRIVPPLKRLKRGPKNLEYSPTCSCGKDIENSSKYLQINAQAIYKKG